MSEAAAAAGLLVREASRRYLPDPLPDHLRRVTDSLEVKILVIGWNEATLLPWL